MSVTSKVYEGYVPIDLGRTATVHGVDLAWDRWGADHGTPLVLGHGFSGSAQDFALEIPLLAASRPVITFDRRGHGTSTNTGDAATYTVAQLEPGTYRLEQSNATWCHAESDNVDEQGDVVVKAGARSSVWVFNCEAAK